MFVAVGSLLLCCFVVGCFSVSCWCLVLLLFFFLLVCVFVFFCFFSVAVVVVAAAAAVGVVVVVVFCRSCLCCEFMCFQYVLIESKDFRLLSHSNNKK